jgi:hypothetical protein
MNGRMREKKRFDPVGIQQKTNKIRNKQADSYFPRLFKSTQNQQEDRQEPNRIRNRLHDFIHPRRTQVFLDPIQDLSIQAHKERLLQA